MFIEVHDFHTTFWSRREDAQMHKYNWAFLTWCPPFPWGRSHCRPGDLKKFLHENYGSDAVGILVEGELWTEESVFWQNKLQDRGVYEVVYRKPWFFQFLQLQSDRECNVPWDTDVPLADPVDDPPKLKVVHGPTRFPDEEDLPAEDGTNWGPQDSRTGTSLRQMELQVEELPPPYSES